LGGAPDLATALISWMENHFDVVVIGLGAMGSATAYQLAKHGSRVLGIDQFSPPHSYGSTHGETRIIRQAIGEGEAYTPLVLRSYELWRELEREAGKTLLTITGGLILESQQSEAVHGRRNFFEQTLGCARKFHIPHEILEAKELKKRYPQFSVTDERGYFENGAGHLKPELCIEAELALAKQFGAAIHINERVLAIDGDRSAGVAVTTDRAVYQADRVVIAAGPWLAQFLKAAELEHFKVYRQVMYWFRIKDDFRPAFSPKTCPIFIWAFEKGGHIGFYGFPSLDGRSIKVATEQYATTTSPETVDRAVLWEEAQSMFKDCIQDRLPGISNICESAVSCLYTTTPDSNFVIDFYPGNDRIVIASACSGHGFKHSAAVGEVVSELILYGRSKIDISNFSIQRFAAVKSKIKG
jgi:sarcosine oxidase